MRSIVTVMFLVAGIIGWGSIAYDAPAQAGQTQAAQGQKPAAKPHDMTGCLAKGDKAGAYRLTNVEKGPKTVEIRETAAGLKIDAHVGHKVTITGTAISDAPAGEHHMRVEAVKHVSPTCP